MTRKPESYPYLRIARKYNIPYRVILAAADRLHANRQERLNAAPINRSHAARREVNAAFEEQRMVREGLIDWQTGASLKP